MAETREPLPRLLKDNANGQAIYDIFQDRVGHGIASALTNAMFTLDELVQRVNELTAEVDALRAAREAWHYYVCASDQELRDAGLTRADALRLAYEADDTAAALAPRQTTDSSATPTTTPENPT